MFRNSGKKIKTLAIIVFIISIICTITLSFVFGFSEYNSFYYTHTEFEAVYFFSILVGGSVVSYISSLTLYAFGELVESSLQTEVHIKEYVELTQKRDNQSVNSSDSSTVSRNVSITQTKPTAAHSYPKTSFKTCPKCGEENPGNKRFCYNCGEAI